MTPSHDAELTAELAGFYAAAATKAGTGESCSEGGGFGARLYGDETVLGLPPQAVAASMGCGNPFAVADIGEGDVVLDLGSGGGIDVLLSAKRVGPTGRAYGLDMTPEMLDLARRNATEAGAHNVEFLEGRIEEIPLPDASVDVVISNCVINLSPDKTRVFGEIARVLRPSGRLGVTDVVAEGDLPPVQGRSVEWNACAAGALSTSEYERALRNAGFTDIAVEITHPVANGFHSAIIRARKNLDSA
jgi:ubiquinone/menaquinone biosynthesis C-methylase UbiE